MSSLIDSYTKNCLPYGTIQWEGEVYHVFTDHRAPHTVVCIVNSDGSSVFTAPQHVIRNMPARSIFAHAHFKITYDLLGMLIADL